MTGPRSLARSLVRDYPLMRMYPQCWRERYAEEFTALLDDHKAAGRPVLLDVLRGALDAHLHRGRYPMTTDRAARWPSLAVLTGCVAVIALMVVAGVRYPATFDSKGAAVFLVIAAAMVGVYLVFGGGGDEIRRLHLASQARGPDQPRSPGGVDLISTTPEGQRCCAPGSSYNTRAATVLLQRHQKGNGVVAPIRATTPGRQRCCWVATAGPVD